MEQEEYLLLLANNPNTHTYMLDDLATHDSVALVTGIAGNANTNSKTLARLAYHDSPEVRMAVAENASSPLAALAVLASDENLDIRYLMAENPHIPISILRELSQDENPFVRVRAEQTLCRIEGFSWKTTQTSIPSQLDESSQKALEPSPIRQNLIPTYTRNISSTLRATLSPIISISELLLSTDLTVAQQKLLQIVQDAGQSLVDFVNDLEDISRIEEASSTNLEKVPFNVIFLVQDLTKHLAALAKKKELTLSTHIDQNIPEFLIGSPEYLRAVLHTLVRFVIRTSNSGQVSLEAFVGVTNEIQTTLRFAIKYPIVLDTPKNTLPQFHGIAAPGTAHFEDIVAQFIKAIGINFEFQQTATEQSILFTLAFETPQLSNVLNQNDSTTLTFPSDTLVLIVEDDFTVGWLTAEQLKKLGVKAQVVSTGQEAIDIIRKVHFDLILMDCYLPQLDGLETTRSIREYESANGGYIPVVAMTAAAMSGDKQKCLEAGMDDYLSKPVTLEQLQQKLKQWLPLQIRLERTLNSYLVGSATL